MWFVQFLYIINQLDMTIYRIHTSVDISNYFYFELLIEKKPGSEHVSNNLYLNAASKY